MAHVITGRKSGFIQRAGSMIRQTRWISLSDFQSTTLAAGSAATLISTMAAPLLEMRPFTIVRTRGTLFLESDQTSVTESQFCAYGHAVVSDQAVAVGITAVPTPFADESDLFFVYQYLVSRFLVTTDIGRLLGGVQLDFDSKAMRKVDEGSNAISVAEAGPTSSGLTLRNIFRQLIKLH